MKDSVEKTLEFFRKISAVPRCSKNEKAIGDTMLHWAEKNSFSAHKDNAGNVFILVPASPGCEEAPVVVLQGHLDMVCEKRPDTAHDFLKDPVIVLQEGDWLKARGTTLGADNGIALALAMDLATDATVRHPPLELLFTADEETGLNGARSLDRSALKGRILINLDSETEGEFIIGCAGGRDILLKIAQDKINIPDTNAYEFFQINVSGLSGGHSGMDIDKGRGNANKILASLAEPLFENEGLLLDISGGTAHNAIPRDAGCLAAIKKEKSENVKHMLEKRCDDIKKLWAETEKKMTCCVKQVPGAGKPAIMQSDKAAAFFKMMNALPNGVYAMDKHMEGLVETSDNVAVLSTENNEVQVLISLRSSSPQQLDELTERIVTLSRQWGASPAVGEGYPPWEPQVGSALLDKCVSLYQKTFGKTPVVKSIHAGLECGIIGSKFEGMEMISMGPDIENPHSPDEIMNVSSLKRLREYLAVLLDSISRENGC